MINIIDEVGLENVSPDEMFDGGSGWRRKSRQDSPQYKRGLVETAKTYAAVMRGDADPYHLRRLRENQGSAQFGFYMGDLLQRDTYEQYERMRGEWRGYVNENRGIRDFRQVERYWMHGGATPAPFMQENEQYSYDAVSGDHVGYKIQKYGKLFGLSWEAMINDDLMLLRDFPRRLANAAVNTEDQFVTRLYFQRGGSLAADTPRDAFHISHGNRLKANAGLGVVVNQALSENAVLAGIQQMQEQTETEGDDELPIVMNNFHLVIPQNKAAYWKQIMETREIRFGDTSPIVDASYTFIRANYMPSMVTVHVNPWLDIFQPGCNSWFLFANPGNTRPGLEVGYLSGYEAPQLFMRAPDTARIGGGGGASDGSFENDQMDYKMRGVFGGTTIDPRMMLASRGTGVID